MRRCARTRVPCMRVCVHAHVRVRVRRRVAHVHVRACHEAKRERESMTDRWTAHAAEIARTCAITITTTAHLGRSLAASSSSRLSVATRPCSRSGPSGSSRRRRRTSSSSETAILASPRSLGFHRIHTAHWTTTTAKRTAMTLSRESEGNSQPSSASSEQRARNRCVGTLLRSFSRYCARVPGERATPQTPHFGVK